MDKIAVITGASRGIGYALALELAAKNISVVAIARSEEDLTNLKHQFPDRINIIVADLSAAAGRFKAIQEILRLGNIQYLIHNAGIITPIAPLQALSEEDIRQILETNLLSPILFTKQLLPSMNRESRILNVSSVAAHQSIPGLGSYCISKAGINMWTNILRQELQENNIFVTSVIPGEVDTPMQQNLRDASFDYFPLVNEFNEAYRHDALIPATICASFLAWLLLDTTEEHFLEQEWNIYDESHHQYWLRQKLPLPLNKQKISIVD